VSDPTVERDDPRVAMTSERFELGGDLGAELAGRHDHERERRGRAAVDPLEDRQGEGAGLPGAGLRLREEVAPGAKMRDRQILDRREGRPTEVARSAIKVRSKSDQVKRGPSYWGPYPIRGPCPWS